MQISVSHWELFITCPAYCFLGVTSPSGGTHISEVEGDLQVVPEQVGEVGVHVQHLQQVVSEDLVKVAVGQSPDIGVGFPRPPVQIDRFAKYVVFSCGSIGKNKKDKRAGGKLSTKRGCKPFPWNTAKRNDLCSLDLTAAAIDDQCRSEMEVELCPSTSGCLV